MIGPVAGTLITLAIEHREGGHVLVLYADGQELGTKGPYATRKLACRAQVRLRNEIDHIFPGCRVPPSRPS